MLFNAIRENKFMLCLYMYSRKVNVQLCIWARGLTFSLSPRQRQHFMHAISEHLSNAISTHFHVTFLFEYSVLVIDMLGKMQ